ncbi:hypothetical protein COHA_004944 [Chlorella ohadii]|uniref:Uncharacterized protein n=1 Tax=Chlorella ohadii TaxID=2649997 RepID=A0AAD5H5T8_9CHLO|nr:hypothetical protein COHA_004944 [Chlorella ohadii]
MSAPANGAENELLRRAVVALERKLREAQTAAAGLERELAAAQAAVADLPSVRAALQHSRAAAEEQQRRADGLARELAGARADAAEAGQQRDRARAALEAEQAADDERCRAAAQRRAEEAAAAQELARARGQAEVLAAQVQQLEGANAMLRQDNRQHAEHLRQAFEREGELLAELAELQAKLRAGGTSSRSRLQPQSTAGAVPGAEAGAAGYAAGVPTAAASTEGCTIKAITARAPARCGSLDGGGEAQMEQLLMAAAQQLTQEYTARLAQAEGRAGQLKQQLQALGATTEQLQREADRQAAAAAAARDEAAQERQAAQALLDNNLRLHEAVAQLMEDGLGWSSGLADGGTDSFSTADVEPVERVQSRGGAGDVRTQRARMEQRTVQLAHAPPVPARKQQQQAQATPAVDPAARQAAVRAALALSAEHRELHSCYRAVAEELRQVACDLAAARGSRQLALLRQHAALQQEQRDLAQQLEDTVVQLAALKRAGVL